MTSIYHKLSYQGKIGRKSIKLAHKEDEKYSAFLNPFLRDDGSVGYFLKIDDLKFKLFQILYF